MNRPGRTAGARVGLPPRQFAAAFPFHVAVAGDLRVVQAGESLARICADVVPGARLDTLFRAVRPEGAISADWIRRNSARFFLLQHHASGLQLRGQFVELPGEGTTIFLCSPWFTDAAEVVANGLGFEDFAIHDPMLDLLQVFQASKMALADAKRLADKLAAQRSDLRAANERLRQQEAESRKLALIAARTDNGVVLTDAMGRVEWVNEGFTRISGYSLAEVIGRTPGSLMQGAGTDRRTVERIRARLRAGQGFQEEILNYRKDGGAYWIAVEVQPIRDEEGRVVNFMAIESDITARRSAQRRLAIGHEVSATLAEMHDPSAIFARILEIICLHLDWQAGQVWKVAGQRLRLIESWQRDPRRMREFVAESRSREFAPGEGLPGRVWATGAPATIIDASSEAGSSRGPSAARAGLRGAIAMPLPAGDGLWGVMEFFVGQAGEPEPALLETLAAIGAQLGQYIERRQAQTALRRSEERFRGAFEDAHAGMAIGGVDTSFRLVNRTFCDMLGYSEEELLGRTSLSITHPEDAAISAEAARRLASGETDRVELEKRFVRRDGEVVWAIVRARRQSDRDGEQLVSHFLDITKRKRVEQQLQEERRLREEARRRELEMGHDIQRTLLVGDAAPRFAGTDIASYSEPSQVVDGDFCAFTALREDCLDVVVGDVMGKGVPAALVGAAIRIGYSQVAAELMAGCLAAGELPSLAAIADGLHRRLTPRLIELETFATLALYRLDLSGPGIRLVNAGHTPGLLLRRDGGVERLLGDNAPLGVLEGERYVETAHPVQPGDALLLYSDGLTEASGRGGEEFGEARLRAFLEEAGSRDLPAAICLQVLRRRVREFVGGDAALDDQTAVMIRLLQPSAGGPDASEETFVLPWELAGLDELRTRLAGTAAIIGSDAADRLVLAAFEVATNVVRHVEPPCAGASLCCRIRRADAGVNVELWHAGAPFVPESARLPDAESGQEGGYGLYIIESAVDRVSYERPLPDASCTRLVQTAGADARR